MNSSLNVPLIGYVRSLGSNLVDRNRSAHNLTCASVVVGPMTLKTVTFSDMRIGLCHLLMIWIVALEMMVVRCAG